LDAARFRELGGIGKRQKLGGYSGDKIMTAGTAWAPAVGTSEKT
jgi:hypothetical protein